MKNIFFSSDPHVSHSGVWERFKRPDGTPLRDFSSSEEMNEYMIEKHNSVVGPNDIWYCLGDVDVSWKGKHIDLIKRFNGKKRLVKGNHDMLPDQLYYDVGFEKISGVRVFTDKFICSHIPLHPSSISDRFRANVHGHLHFGRVMKEVPWEDSSGIHPYITKEVIDPRYYSVCMEMLPDYTPMHFDEVDAAIAKQMEFYDYEAPKGWGNGSGPD